MTIHPKAIQAELRELQQTADCRRRRVGAILVHTDTGRIVGRGWNALPPQGGSCQDGACPRGLLSYAEQPAFTGYGATGCTAIHAEIRAIREADANGRLYSGELTCFVTATPCYECNYELTLIGAHVVVVQMPDTRLSPDQAA